MTPTDATVFAAPAKDPIVLPFPSIQGMFPMNQSNMSGNRDWKYIQRVKFQELLDGVRESIAKPYAGLWLYGTTGYGKSHLLAALVCYLVATGFRVVYIPDCRACLLNPFEYVRDAMSLCWAGSPALQLAVMALRTQDDISKFLSGQPTGDSPIIFVIDQMNALETESSTEESTNKRKADLERWLMEISSKHKSIFSSSANNISYRGSIQGQLNLLRVNAYGGLTKVRSIIGLYLASC